MARKWLTYFPGKAVFKVEHILQTLQTFFLANFKTAEPTS